MATRIAKVKVRKVYKYLADNIKKDVKIKKVWTDNNRLYCTTAEGETFNVFMTYSKGKKKGETDPKFEFLCNHTGATDGDADEMIGKTINVETDADGWIAGIYEKGHTA